MLSRSGHLRHIGTDHLRETYAARSWQDRSSFPTLALLGEGQNAGNEERVHARKSTTMIIEKACYQYTHLE
jgi:hypothetical protein